MMLRTPNRLRLLWALIEGERNVEELTEQTGSPKALSPSSFVLREARLVKARREGRRAL